MNKHNQALNRIKELSKTLDLSFDEDTNELIINESIIITHRDVLNDLRTCCKLLGSIQVKDLVNYFKNKACN